MVRVLFVCTGNICRSPLAQGVFESLLEREGLSGEVEVDSAGTHAYHAGEPPDLRAQRSALKRGIDLGGQRARRVEREDCEKFDYVLVMDRENYSWVEPLCEGSRTEVQMFLDYAQEYQEREVPDPYFGGAEGFERTLELAEAASRGLLEDILRRDLVNRV